MTTQGKKDLTTHWAWWLYSVGCGAIWGLGLARTLTHQWHSAFFNSEIGGLVATLLGIILSTALACWRDTHTWSHILKLTPLLLPAIEWLLPYTSSAWRSPVLVLGGLALTALWHTPFGQQSAQQNQRWGLLLAIIIPLSIYLPDVSPYVGRADTFEFQVVAPRLGVAHPSGYPLYILIGKLFSLFPLGSPAWRVNLSSAVFAALASGMMFLTVEESFSNRGLHSSSFISHPSSLISLFTALTLAFSPTLWSRAIEAEVYSLNAFLVILGLWLIQRTLNGKLARHRALLLLALLTGVAMASHLTLGALVFLAIPLLIQKPLPTLRTLLLSAGLGLAGLCLYLYIPLRWPAITGEWMSPQDFLNFITNAGSGGALLPMAFWHDPSRWALVWERLLLQIGWPGILLTLWGLGQLLWKKTLFGLSTLLMFGAWLWFNLSFYVADPDYSAFLIPAHVVMIFWMGMGIKAEGKRQKDEGGIWTQLWPVFLTGLALFPLSRLWITGPTLNTITLGKADEAWGRYVLQLPLAENAAILADSEKHPPLYYLQQVAGIRPDLELITHFNEAQYRADLEQRLASGQTVYLARYLPGLDAFGVSSAGPLVEVAASNKTTQIAQHTFGKQLSLLDYALAIDSEGRAMHHLTLTWQAESKIEVDLTVRVRLRKGESVVWEKSATRPVNGYTTTQAWQEGQVVNDYHALNWPAWLPSGIYTLEIGIFPRFEEQGWITESGELWLLLTDIALTPAAMPSAQTPHHHLFVAPNVWLVGSDLPGEVPAGSTLSIDLEWFARKSTQLSGVPILQWKNADQTFTQHLEHGIGTHDSTIKGHTMRRYTLTAPSEMGDYTLNLGWVQDEHTLSPARCEGRLRQQPLCEVGNIHIGVADAGLANFDKQIILVDAALNADGVPAGGQAHIDLQWRGLRTLTKDYTVFVQIVGPDGKLYGQVDSWPVQGTYPTSQWQPGEDITDPYHLYLTEDAPAGEYTVIVGWYLLADMRRLPVHNKAGQTIGDFYTVGEFQLEN